jgi:transposase-like protein
MKKKQTRTPVEAEFKREAVRLVRENPEQTMVSIARGLGIEPNQLYAWVNQAKRLKENAFPGHGNSSDEVQALRRELKLVTQERDILKNAIRSRLPSHNGRDEIRIHRAISLKMAVSIDVQSS